MDTFISLIVVMISRVYAYVHTSELTKLYTLNMCSFCNQLYLNKSVKNEKKKGRWEVIW